MGNKSNSNGKKGRISNNSILLIMSFFISLLIATMSIPILDILDNLSELYLNQDSNTDNEPGELFLELIKNIILTLILLALIIFGFKQFFKLRRTRLDSLPKFNPKVKPKSDIDSDILSASKQSPKKMVGIYIILLPSIHTIIVMFSGDILNMLNVSSVDEYPVLYTIFMNPALLFWGITGKKYLWIWKKLPTAKWFEIFGYDYVILERQILRKVIIGAVVTLIILWIFFSVFTPDPKMDNYSQFADFWGYVSLGLFFNLMIIVLFSFTKIIQQNQHKDFHLFLASGFCKKAIKSDDDLKTKYMRNALNSYNNFFKRNHNDHILENVEKINININSKKLYTNSTIDELSRSFESGHSYLPLEKLAKLMGKEQKEDLLIDNSISKRLQYWSGYFGPVLAAIVSFILSRIFQ